MIRGTLFSLMLASATYAGTITVQTDTPIYDQPSATAKVVTRVAAGRALQDTGEEKNGFRKLKTKSGAALWIPKRAIASIDAEEDDLVTANRAQSQAPEQWTMDFGASLGSQSGQTFLEAALGVNYLVNDWLVWRNAVFYRTGNAALSMAGLDSSIRAVADFRPLHTFAGVGYRIATTAAHAPFAEGGLIFQQNGFTLGAGLKYVLLSATGSGNNEMLYSFVLSFRG